MKMIARAAALVALACLIAAPAVAQQTREHILLYTSKATSRDDALARGLSARIDDSLEPVNPLQLDPSEIPSGEATYNLRKTRGVAVPTSANGAGVADAATHWLAYTVKSAKGACANDPARSCSKPSDCAAVGGACDVGLQEAFDRKQARNQALRVVDRYSDLRVDLGRESTLLFPASFDASGPLPAPGVGERFKCYDVKPTKKVCSNHPRTACRRDSDCPDLGETCTQLAKFPKQTHPGGLHVILENPIATALDALDPERPVQLSKVKMYCQSTDTVLPDAPGPDLREEPQAGFLCYGIKALRKACAGGSNDKGACRSNADCPGNPVAGVCRDEPKFDNSDPQTIGLYAGDDVAAQRVDLRKEDLLCVPACKEPPAAPSFSPHVLRINSLQLDTSDHSFAPLAGIANGLIADAVAFGSINILFEADRFGDGPQELNGYTGELDPGNLGCNVSNPAHFCQYLVPESSLDPDAIRTRTTCGNAGLIVIPVEIEGTDSTPTATLEGGDENTSFSLDLPFTATVSLALSARNVRVSGTLAHSGTAFTGLSSGVLEGAVINREFKQTANELPQGLCQGGFNNNEPCFLSDAMCPGGYCEPLTGTCLGGSNNNGQCGSDSACPDPRTANPSDACVENYIAGFTPAQIAGFIDLIGRDTDLDGIKTCEGATNDGTPCETLSDCPDQNGPQGAFCDQNEASSLRLLFGAIDAEINGVTP